MRNSFKDALFDPALLHAGLNCKCPRCGKGNLYKPGIDLVLNDKCASCELDLAKNDSADGPAVFLMFILGFLIIPPAIICVVKYNWSFWLMFSVWGGLTIALTIGTIRYLKAYVIALQYKHRPNDWA